VPRLTAREQCDDLQQRGQDEDPRCGSGERGGELVAAPGQKQPDDRGRGKRADDRDRRMAPATEAAEAGGERSQPSGA
jgi:hypothetical protein